MKFVPLEVTARLLGPIVLSSRIALDALLGAAIVRRDGIPIASIAAECVPLPIPVAEERGIYLASEGVCVVEARERTWINRRFPVAEAQRLAGPELRRIDISTGPCKSYRIPLQLSHLESDTIRWWCLGDETAVRELLVGWVGYLGKKRSVGHGLVARWTVEPCASWPGFPVVRDGQPLRSLPPDWPGLASDNEHAYAVLRPPYWDRTAEVLCAVPRG